MQQQDSTRPGYGNATPGSVREPVRYAVITPVRDEEKFLPGMIESVARQTVLPSQWIIVDDGSTDGTFAVIERYAEQHDWIHGVRRSNRGFRKAGGGVIEAFYDGYQALATADWDFIVKLDGDLLLSEDYFERCFEYFASDSRLGIGGGVIFHEKNGQKHLEENPEFHVRGATKIYRRQCWEAIGGLLRAPGWDTIDEVSANMHGWTTRSFRDVPLHQQRPTGTAESQWRNYVKDGTARYVAGYHPLFLLASCLLRIGRKPLVIGSVGVFYGYARGYWSSIPQVDDPQLIKFIRQEQIKRLLGKPSIWK